MKKRKGIILVLCVLAVCTVGVTLFIGRRKKPYKNLDVSQIVSAAVLLSPPDKTVQITDLTELVEHLEDLVIYNKNDCWKRKGNRI